jgi:hypothetical protein
VGLVGNGIGTSVAIPITQEFLCLDLKAYSWEEPICCEPLNLFLPGITEEPDFLGPVTSEWVLQEVMGVCHQVGL